MTVLLRRFRGLGIALTVLALSAGAVFAATPSMRPSSNASDQAKAQVAANADPTRSPEATESPEPSDSAEPTDAPKAPTTPTTPTTPATPSPDTHGALVSTAAQMPTPSGFPNHGAFVSCVAHLSVSLTGFDWNTVTPAFCGVTTGASAKGNHASADGIKHSTAGKAKGAAARAAHGPSNH